MSPRVFYREATQHSTSTSQSLLYSTRIYNIPTFLLLILIAFIPGESCLQYLRNIRVNLYKRSREGDTYGESWIVYPPRYQTKFAVGIETGDPIKPGADHFSLPRRFIPRNGREIVLPTFLLPDLFTVARPSGGHPQSSAWNNPHPYTILCFIVLWFRAKIAPAKGHSLESRWNPSFRLFSRFPSQDWKNYYRYSGRR